MLPARTVLSNSASKNLIRASAAGFHNSGVGRNPPNPFANLKKIENGESEVIKSRIAAIVGDANVSVADSVRSQHGQDEGPMKGESPDIVAYPGSVEEVSEIHKLCHSDSIPIIPFGTGTGLEAGISALHGGICMDLTKMNQIRDYHPEDFDCVVEPGVTRLALNHHLKNDGLWFPVDPGADASVCGMCATGASGTNAVSYGTMKENVINMEVVLPNGEILYTAGKDKRPKKNSAGYDLTHLFLGSEGTLGTITKATVKLHAQPEQITSAVVHFPTVQDAINAVVMTMQCSIPIARIELLDDMAIRACNQYNKMDMEEAPTLFLEFHASSADMENMVQTVEDICKDNNGGEYQWATKTEDRNKLWTARHKIYYAALGLQPGCRSITTDVCVPVTQLPEMLSETRADIEKSGILGPIAGHAGDGNFHVFLLFDPDNQEQFKVCKEVSHRMASRAIDLGGTCTGEHGIGTGKMGLLQAQMGQVGVDTMWTIKRAIDPKGIMNPGKVLPF